MAARLAVLAAPNLVLIRQIMVPRGRLSSEVGIRGIVTPFPIRCLC